jgi:hypothetical protein
MPELPDPTTEIDPGGSYSVDPVETESSTEKKKK